MKTHKRFLAMLLAAVMTLALVACGGDTNPGTDTPNTDAPGDTTTPDSDTNDPAAPPSPTQARRSRIWCSPTPAS